MQNSIMIVQSARIAICGENSTPLLSPEKGRNVEFPTTNHNSGRLQNY